LRRDSRDREIFRDLFQSAFATKSARKRLYLSLIGLTGAAAAAVLGGNALPIQKIDLFEGPTRLIEEQHEPQAIGQIGVAGEIYPWVGHG
jgi:hypothetical protein